VFFCNLSPFFSPVDWVEFGQRYPDVKDVHLIWYYVAYDKEFHSKRTDAQLNQLKKDTIQLIDTIEKEESFPAQTSFLYEWCEYQPACPQYAHLYKLEGKPANEYLNDPGVKLVNRYAELQDQKNDTVDELDTELEKLKEAIIAFAKRENVGVVFGSNKKVKITISEKTMYPSKNDDKRLKLNASIKKAGLWDEVSDLDVYALIRALEQPHWPKQLVNEIKKYQTIEKTERITVSKIKNKEE